MRCLRFVVPFLIIALTASALCPTAAGQAPTLQSATFFGGAGDQRGTAAAVLNDQIYVGGSGVIGGYWSGALLVRYSIPPGAPLGSTTLPTHTYFLALTATPETVYPAGVAYPPRCGATDGVGDTEDKSGLALLDADDGAFVSCQSTNFFPYTGSERFFAVQTITESGSPMIYAAGFGETCGWGRDSFVVYKYDSAGGFINRASEPGVPWGACFRHSIASGIATLSGDIYVVGRRGNPPYPWYGGYWPIVMKYDSGLVQLWDVTSAETTGEFTAATALNGAIYAVGATGINAVPENRDFLVEKYNESDARVWRQTSGTATEDVLTGIVAVGDRLFAVGYTRGAGSGGADMVILEIDPGTGVTLSTRYYGGTLDDFARGATTEGIDLYVAGESRSFASDEGNSVGQNDMVLLRYSIVLPNQPPVANAGPNQTVECTTAAGCNVTLDGSASSDPDNDPLTYEWKDENGAVVGSAVVVNVTVALGTHTYTLTVNDGKGGTAPDNVAITVQDTTPPALTLASDSTTVVLPSAGASGASVNVLAASGAAATDQCDPNPTLAPAGSAQYSLGTTTVNITATDASHNSSQKPFTVNVVYNFAGFFQPINSDGTSIFKAGRTIAVKFRLTAADGSIISNAVATLAVAKVSNQVIGVFEEAEASGASNPDNYFRFDPTAGQYIYNLSTVGYTAGTYVLRATLNDGTDHDVYVSVR